MSKTAGRGREGFECEIDACYVCFPVNLLLVIKERGTPWLTLAILKHRAPNKAKAALTRFLRFLSRNCFPNPKSPLDHSNAAL